MFRVVDLLLSLSVYTSSASMLCFLLIAQTKISNKGISMDLWKILNPPEPTTTYSSTQTRSQNQNGPTSTDASPLFTVDDDRLDMSNNNRSLHGLRTDTDAEMVEPARHTSASSSQIRFLPDETASLAGGGNANGWSPIGDGAPRVSRDVPTSKKIQAPGPGPDPRRGTASVISAVEKLFESIVDSLREKEELSIEIKVKRPPAGSAQAGDVHDIAMSKIKFPGSTAQEAWRFSMQAVGPGWVHSTDSEPSCRVSYP